MKKDCYNIAANAALISRLMNANNDSIESIDNIVKAAMILSEIESEDSDIYETGEAGLWEETCAFIAKKISIAEINGTSEELSKKDIQRMMSGVNSFLKTHYK